MSMMGEMKFFLGLQVNQFSNGIFINESKYIHDILKRFGMENCDTVPTNMVEQAKLKLDLVGKPVDHTDYRSMIGSLMYVTSSRPDIMFATCMCARYQANPNEYHVSAVKRIFHYLKGTINLGLCYPKDYGFDLTTYSDADHAGCHLDRKSTSGSVQFLGDKLSIDYDETLAPVARIEAICLFLAYATHKDFTVFQMDVKIAFLNGILKEEVSVGQALGSISKQYPDHVYALDKVLYGLKQAPRAWYDILSQFLIDSGF
nr:uncharacterized mitochondrial protein AtMg00810-like [Tanacetum cinerariifolium]